MPRIAHPMIILAIAIVFPITANHLVTPAGPRLQITESLACGVSPRIRSDQENTCALSKAIIASTYDIVSSVPSQCLCPLRSRLQAPMTEKPPAVLNRPARTLHTLCSISSESCFSTSPGPLLIRTTSTPFHLHAARIVARHRSCSHSNAWQS